MRVVFVASGKSYHATRWANSLACLGHEIHFISVHELERELDENVYFYNLQVKFSRLKYFQFFRVYRIVKNIDPDLVHVHSFGGYSFISLLACYFYKNIISAYGTDIYVIAQKSFLKKQFFKLSSHLTDLIVCASKDLKKATEENLSYKASIRVIPFGVDIKKFSIRNNPIANQKKFSIGIVKKLEMIYGIDVLIKAFRIVKQKNPQIDMSLIIYGVGSQLAELQILSGRDLDSSIFFRGSIPNSDVPSVLKNIDLFVVPSRSESFGVSAVEASAVGLPIIASNVGGLPEVVKDGVTGLLFESENVYDLVKKIQVFLNNENLLIQFGSNGASYVRQYFDWAKCLSSMNEEYKALIKND